MWIHYCSLLNIKNIWAYIFFRNVSYFCLFETPKGKIDAPYDQNITLLLFTWPPFCNRLNHLFFLLLGFIPNCTQGEESVVLMLGADMFELQLILLVQKKLGEDFVPRVA